MRINKKWAIVIGILVVLIVARLCLPYFVTRYVNKVLADIEGYQGSIEDVDISLWRGAYVIHQMKLEKVEGEVPVPFIDIPKMDLSVEWEALLDGAIVGKIRLEYPKLNFVAGPTEEETQTGKETDWTEPIKELMPLQINKFEIVRGKISYLDFHADPKVDVAIDSVNAVAMNLNNAQDNNDRLPSKIRLTGTSVGGGHLDFEAEMNILKPIPDFDADLKFTEVNLPALNDFIKAYGKFDVEQGTFNLYSEMILLDGNFEGYVKPMMIDMKVLDLEEDSEDKDNVFQLIWEGIAELTSKIVENPSEDQVASRVPITGNIGNVETDVWTAIITVLGNAYVEALKKEVDNTVKLEE